MAVDEALLQAVLDGIGDGFYALDRDWRVTLFNAGAEAHFGLARADALGRTLWEIAPGSYETTLGHRFREVMATGEPAIIQQGSVVAAGRFIEGRLFPLAGGLGVAFRDMTERRQAEDDLRKREAELARVQRIAGVGGLEVDLQAGFANRRSPEYLKLHGLPPSAAFESHEAWVQRIHPDDRKQVEGDFRAAVDGTAAEYQAEYRIIRPVDGEERWIFALAEIERDACGKPLRLVGAHRDVTERKQAERRRQILINELNHRVKNTLATVQSIASQSLRSQEAGQEIWRTFEGRLLALSRAHDVLTRDDWLGADLKDIVREALAPFQVIGQDRIFSEGPSARLAPSTALALAMSLQELATNAMKYGSLSEPGGSIAMSWHVLSVDDSKGGRVHLDWHERGGPPVTPPTRRGMGIRMIERSLSHDLGGKAVITFAPTGLQCAIEAALA